MEKPRRLETAANVWATSGPSMNFCHSTREAVLLSTSSYHLLHTL